MSSADNTNCNGNDPMDLAPVPWPRPRAASIVLALLLFLISAAITGFQHTAWDTFYEREMKEHPSANIALWHTEEDRRVALRLRGLFILWPLGVTLLSLFGALALLGCHRWRWWWGFSEILSECALFCFPLRAFWGHTSS